MIEYVFMIILLIEGIYVSYEGIHYREYKFHEPWLIFYSTYLIFSISWCFHWKRMIILYWFIQILNLILLHLVYEKLNFYFYVGYAFITILLPLVWMLIARIILVFLMLIRNNQELVKIIYKILQIFPEGFLIQELDKDSEQLIVQFVNDTAAKEIVNYENPCGKPIDDSKLNYTVKKINTSQDETQHYPNDEGRIIASSLSKTLQSHVNIIENNIEAIYSIEILDERKSDDS